MTVAGRTCGAGTLICRRWLSIVVWTRRARRVASQVLVLELMGETVGHIVVAASRRAVSCARRHTVAELLWVCVGVVVVEVALLADAARGLLGSPDLLLPRRVWEWLRKSGRRRWESTTLLGGEVRRVGEAEVQVQTVRVAGIGLLLLLLALLLLLLVGHGGDGVPCETAND